jgi:hypothetical protein
MSSHEQTAIAEHGIEHAGHTVEVPHGHAVEAHGVAHGESIHLPRPTGWPITVALGFTLLVAGILTQYVISILGAVLIVVGCVGWFKEVLPAEAHEHIQVQVQEIEVATSRRSVARIEVTEEHRAHLPVHTFSIGSGIKGGIAGGIAMILPALAYGLIAQHSIWYPVNLLGGAGVGGGANPSLASLRAFHVGALGAAVVIHVVTCLLIGTLYGAILPLMPRRPIVLGGIIAPLIWSGLLYAALPTINPEIASHINWAAFLISQFTFGIVAGYVVSRSEHLRTSQSMPFAMRAGLHTPGLSNHGSSNQDREDRH